MRQEYDMICTCPIDFHYEFGIGPGDPPQAECMLVTTTTSPPGCPMEDGTVIKPGENWTSTSGCKGCHCDVDSVQAACWEMHCAALLCVDAVSTPGSCCQSCPNGKT